MPTESGSRTVVLRGLAPGGPKSETAINLVDCDGKTIQSAPVHEDGSCVLAEEALAAAEEVFLGPIELGFRAHPFRALLEMEDSVDLAALLTGPDVSDVSGMRSLLSLTGYPRDPHPGHHP
jgi:hypothetical protein